MAYTSDLRVKNLIKEIDLNIRKKINNKDIEKYLNLRIFDESNEDAILYTDGGLSFIDPNNNYYLGSNDAGWFFLKDNSPIVIVEGTFGTERGQFGDGQLNRVSHSLGVALNDFIGVTLVPYKGQSFVKDGKRKDLLSKKINYQNGLLHKGMVTLALNFSKNNAGKFLIIDPYDEGVLEDLVINSLLKKLGLKNELEKIIDNIVIKMKEYLGDSVYGSRSSQTIEKLFNTDKKPINCKARIYTQNIEALTTSTKRDAHGLLGKNLIEIYSSSKDIYSIFIRLNKKDVDLLKKRNSKEFQYLLNNKKVTIISIDDLFFEDNKTKKKLIDFQTNNLHQNSEKAFIKEIRGLFNSGKIMIKSNL